MTPSHAALYPTNDALLNAIFGGYFSLQPTVPQDGKNLLLREFSGGTSLTSIGRSVLNSILLVSRRCVPSEISQFVIGRIPVIVTTFTTARRRTTKGQQNESPNAHGLGSIVSPEKKEMTPIFFCWSGLFDAACASVFYSTKIRHGITSLKASDWFPAFHNYIPIVRYMGIIA